MELATPSTPQDGGGNGLEGDGGKECINRLWPGINVFAMMLTGS